MINSVKIISLLSPAKSNEFRSNINVMTESIRDVSLDKDGIAYVIMCTTPKGRMELYQAQLEEAVNSFRVS